MSLKGMMKKQKNIGASTAPCSPQIRSRAGSPVEGNDIDQILLLSSAPPKRTSPDAPKASLNTFSPS